MEWEIAYALSALWSLGCVGLPLWATVYLWRDYERGMASTCFLIGFPVGVLMAVFPWALWQDQRSPDLATLKKNAWACTASHDETTMILVGKVMVPQHRTICDAYSRTR